MGTLVGIQSAYVVLALWRSRKSIVANRPRLRLADTPNDDEMADSSEAA